MKKYLTNSIMYFYSFLFFIIFLCNICFNNINYATKLKIVSYNFLLLPLGILILAIIYLSAKKIAKLVNINKFFKITSILFFIYLLLATLFTYFENSYDAGHIGRTAYTIAINSEIYKPDYFSYYPNNIMLLQFEIFIFKLVNYFSMDNYSYIVFVVINCFLIFLVSKFLIKILYLLKFEKTYVVFCYLLYWLYIGFSPWAVIFYSDIVAMTLIVVILYLFLSLHNESSFFKIAVFGFLIYPSYKIKPQIIILVIAIIIYSLLHKKIKVNIYIYMIVSIIVSVILTTVIIKSVPISIDKNKNFTATHYLMMGLGDDYMGTYSIDDYNISKSSNNVEEREKINIDISKQRIENYGFYGICNHLKRKLLASYNDGLFTWENDIEFKSPPKLVNRFPKICSAYKEIYYANGKYYFLYEIFMQSTWLAILFFNIFQKKDNYKIILNLAIIGLTLFLLIFECRARYLYQYSPIFIIVATCGLSNLVEKITTRFYKWKK